MSLLAAALALCCVWSGAAADKKASSDDQALAAKVLRNAARQHAGSAVEPVESQLVLEAPAAALANGDGDISTTGACARDTDFLCRDLPPGEGRLAGCIRTHVQNEEQGNVVGRVVTDECKEEVADFFADRATNVNKNLGLASACKADISKLCKKLPTPAPEGAVLACLRAKQSQLRLGCRLQIVKAKLAAAYDFLADPTLAAACRKDADKHCADVPPGGGRRQKCLRDKEQDLEWPCRAELFRQRAENADDIRFDAHFFQACRGDLERFCSDVQYGGGRMQACLEAHRRDDAFSDGCTADLEAMMEARASDYRLDPALRRACAADIATLCGTLAKNAEKSSLNDGRVIGCLKANRERIGGRECARAVRRVIERESEDVRMDDGMRECYQDREQFCAGHSPGSARVIRCLQDNRSNLSVQCGRQLLELEMRISEDVDFQFPLRTKCADELRRLCGDVKSGHARRIRCLQEHVGARDMGAECRAEVRRNVNVMARDYRLNYRLRTACDVDITTTCKEACTVAFGAECGGATLRCLRDHMDSLQSAECREEVFYWVKMEVADVRNDVALAHACRGDVDTFCAGIEPGDGRHLECLRQHRAELSSGCLDEELKLSRQQARDVRLRPRLMKLCGEEMVVFCKAVKPGSGAVFTCLLEHVQKPNFGAQCKRELVERERRLKSDYRLDAGVSGQCARDIEAHCAAERANAHGEAGVLKCLAGKMMDPELSIAEQCEAQMSRAVRMAFWDYEAGTALTAACDKDVTDICKGDTSRRSVYTIGVVGRCLSKQLAQGKPMSAECRKLVTVAAPKDIRMFLQGEVNKDGTMKGNVQKAMERARRTTSVITLNGWVAVLSIMCSVFLTIMGAVWLYRRHAGLDKAYTLLVPKAQGEAGPSGAS